MPRIGEIKVEGLMQRQARLPVHVGEQHVSPESRAGQELQAQEAQDEDGNNNTETLDHNLTPFRGREENRRCLGREARIMPIIVNSLYC